MTEARRPRRIYQEPKPEWPDWFLHLLGRLDPATFSVFNTSLHADRERAKQRQQTILEALTETYDQRPHKDDKLSDQLLEELNNSIRDFTGS